MIIRNRIRFVVFCVAAVTLSAGLLGAKAQEPRDNETELRAASKNNLDNLLRRLRPLLSNGGSAARLYYSTHCVTGMQDGLLFPTLELNAPRKKSAGLNAVRDIFRRSELVTVTEDNSGMMRIRTPNVSGDLLKTKIDKIAFTPVERYNVNDAIAAIQRTRPVQSATRGLGINEAVVVFVGRVLDPVPGLPHLPAVIKNVTFDQALDRVAQAFNGLIVYGECTAPGGSRTVAVTFEPLAHAERRYRPTRIKQKR